MWCYFQMFRKNRSSCFCNGGDRAEDNTPELDAFENDDRVLFVWGVGGNNKMNSSSWILENYFNRQRKILGI